MSDPTTVNKSATIVNQVLKTLIENGGEAAAETALIAEFPWLGLPFVKQLMEFILDKVATIIYTQAAEAATKIIIDVQVNLETSSVLNAFQSLQMAIASGDTSAIDKASKDLDAAYGALIHSDGAASP